MPRYLRERLICGALVIAFVTAAAATLSAQGMAPPKPPGNDDCLACHAEDAGTVRANGTPVAVNTKAFSASIHGAAGLACVDCHADLATLTELPHPERLKPAQCASCHAEAAAAYGTSVHFEARRSGKNLTAATCV